jgi:hypothetical protein
MEGQALYIFRPSRLTMMTMITDQSSALTIMISRPLDGSMEAFRIDWRSASGVSAFQTETLLELERNRQLNQTTS